jgi:predicted aspartyl protease
MAMKTLIAAALMLAAAVPARAAEDCRLRQIADFALKKSAGGDYLFPVTIAGQERWFEVGLSKPFSAILGSFADAQKFQSRPLPPGIAAASVDGQKVEQVVKVADIAIGPAHGTKFDMFRVEGALSGEPDVVGVAGMDLLANFDVELDLKNSRMKLFSQDHCSGKVVYWAGSYGEAPFEKDPSGHFTFTMRLDGERVHVDFEVTAGSAAMDMNVAKRIFDLNENSPNMQALQGRTQPAYRYPFKTLAMDEIAISNPAIVIYKREGPECRPYRPVQSFERKACFGTADLTLRDAELKQMHLYFAFKEKTLYATAADAAPAKAP